MKIIHAVRKIFCIVFVFIFLGFIIAGYIFYQKYVYGEPVKGERLKEAEQIEFIKHKRINEHASMAFNELYDRSSLLFEKISDRVIDNENEIKFSPDKKSFMFHEIEGVFINPKILVSVYNIDERKKVIVYTDKHPVDAEWLADNTIYFPHFIRKGRDGLIIDDKSQISKDNELLPTRDGVLYTKDFKIYFLYHLNRTEEILTEFKEQIVFTVWSPKGDYIVFESGRLKEPEMPVIYYKYDLVDKRIESLATIDGPYYYKLKFADIDTINAFFLNDGEKIKIKLPNSFTATIHEPSMIEVENYHVENGVWTKLNGSGSEITGSGEEM